MKDKQKSVFPKNFLWGASVAGHQVEGGNHDQWTVWELEHAAELAKTAKKRIGHVPAWPEVESRATKPENYISGRGVDHWNRYEEDFNLLKSLNLNSLRFSIEWARLEPEEGVWDEEAVEHYRSYIHELKKRDIEPVLNIWHWTNPVWFEQKGAFKKRGNLHYFDRFINKISKEYGGGLKYIITLNEPNSYAAFGYFTNDLSSKYPWPPGEKNPLSLWKVYSNLVGAHKRAYKILKKSHPHLKVGLASQLANIQARDPHDFFDTLSTKIMRYLWNWWFLNRVNKYQDFTGINYYYTDYYTGLLKLENPKVPLNDLGWYMEPEGLYPLLLRAWAHYKKPIIVTENGVGDMHDQYRRWWIEETIVAMERARSQGVNVIGYFHWSLLDNFEWAMGWWPKFGLIAVDRENGMRRKVRESAKWYAERIDQFRK